MVRNVVREILYVAGWAVAWGILLGSMVIILVIAAP